MKKVTICWCANDCTLDTQAKQELPKFYDLFRYWCFYNNKKILGDYISFDEKDTIAVGIVVLSNGIVDTKVLPVVLGHINKAYKGSTLVIPTLHDKDQWEILEKAVKEHLTDVTLEFLENNSL